MSPATPFREEMASPPRAPKSASREIFSRRAQAARRKPAYALEASRENWRRYDEARQDRQSLQTDPVGYEDDLNLYLYVGNDPLNRGDPTGRQSAIIDVEYKRGTPAPAPGGEAVGVRGSVGIAVGFRENGSVGVYAVKTAGGGRISGQSLDLNVTVTGSPGDQLNGVDVNIADVDVPVPQLRGVDVGGGIGFRQSDQGVQAEGNLSVGLGVAQDFGSAAATTSQDIGTPIADWASGVGEQFTNFLQDPTAAMREIFPQMRPEDDRR